MSDINELQYEYMQERDAREFALGDTLDVKTSVVLAVIVFLAAQSEGFFKDVDLSSCMRHLQYLSVLALVLGGIFAVVELIPRDYGAEGSPSSYEKWLADLKSYYAGKEDSDTLVVDEFIKGKTTRATERIEANIAINKRKSLFLYLSFLCTVISLAVNLLTLARHLF